MTEQSHYERNLDAMVELMRAGEKSDPANRTLGLELERFLVDSDGNRVFFSGEKGVGAVVARMLEQDPDAVPVMIDGNLLGLAYAVRVAGQRLSANVSLEPGAQIELSVGPARTGEALYAAILDFDERVRAACDSLGLDARLVARGYDPKAADPRDIELIPKDRYRIMDDYLPRRGSYARDMMRCSASTQVSVDYSSEAEAVAFARRATVLGPLWAFLFDNSPAFRGEPTPGMARARIWDDLDPERCGLVPGALSGSWGYRPFCEWISTIHPILFTDRDHATRRADDLTAADLMSERDLTRDELLHLVSMVWPTFRLKGFVECREMDALPPRLAVACGSLVGTLMYDDDLSEHLAAKKNLDIEALTDDDVLAARADLEARGWDATPYGIPVVELADAIARVAFENAPTAFDRESCSILAELWSRRMLPRDLGVLLD